jgi:toxin ParE1/3/4
MIDVSKIDLFSLPSLPLSERDLLPDSGAVYFVIDAENRLLYIGKAIHLRQRWKSHHRSSQFESLKQVRLAWLSFDPPLSNEALYRVEQECILHFRPPVNYNSKRRRILVTQTAIEDMRSIWNDMDHTWNREQTNRYHYQLKRCFEEIANGHTRGRRLASYNLVRSVRYEHHYVIFQAMPTQVVILAVLHERMDLMEHLKNRLDE